MTFRHGHHVSDYRHSGPYPLVAPLCTLGASTDLEPRSRSGLELRGSPQGSGDGFKNRTLRDVIATEPCTTFHCLSDALFACHSFTSLGQGVSARPH